MGDAVIRTLIGALAIGVSLTGCASETPSSFGFASTSALAIATPPAVRADVGMGAQDPTYRKTMSDRILTAIALERVTGLKPDPSRFVQ